MKMPKVIFKNKGVETQVEVGLSILEAALENGVSIYHTCGGNCSCSTCRVLVLKGAENLSGPESSEAQVMEAFDLKPPHRLGCQALILQGEVEVEIPDRGKPPRVNKTPPLTKDRHSTY